MGRSRSRSPRREREPNPRRDHDRQDGRRRSRSGSPRDRRKQDNEKSPQRSSRRGRTRSRSPAHARRSRSRSQPRRKSYSRSRSRDRRRRRRSHSASSSSSDSLYHKKRKRRKEKRSKSEERERKAKKREKKKRKLAGDTQAHWGKYGIITEVDIFNKAPEFHTWLVEERKINPETISKDQNKKEFARFVEDFNTATLPHEKYYNMEVYDRRMNAIRSGEDLPPTDDVYDPRADIRAINAAHKKKSKDSGESYMSREQLMELRKVQNERIEAGKMKLLGMDIRPNMGVRMDESNIPED